MCGRIQAQAGGIDAALLDGSLQHPAKQIFPHLPYKGGPAAQADQHGQNVAGSAAGVGLKEGIFPAVGAASGKIDKQFPQGDHIIHNKFLFSGWIFGKNRL